MKVQFFHTCRFLLSLHFTFIEHELHKPESSVFFKAEREEMISCVYVTRDEGRVVVAFSRPVNVSVLTCVYV